MFQPVIPTTGLAGWLFLKSTVENQTDAFNKSPTLLRDTEYFEEKIDTVMSADDLVNDRRLLTVALGAFGLEEDLNNRFLIKTVLEEGTEKRDALANRLADDRYKQLADAFGFGNLGGRRTQFTGFGEDITTKFKARSFEVAVGQQNDSMRLALNAERELRELVKGESSDNTKWFRILGTPPLRAVFETALGLPQGFSQLGIDRQVEVFKEKSKDMFGMESFSDLENEDVRDDLIRTFLVRDQIKNISFQNTNSIALTLLQAAPRFR